MKQISKILNCDCCKQFITDSNMAMVFFEIDSEDRVTELHMSHKGACDTWGTSRSVELFDFTGRNALTVMGGLLEDYKWSSDLHIQLFHLVSAARAVAYRSGFDNRADLA